MNFCDKARACAIYNDHNLIHDSELFCDLESMGFIDFWKTDEGFFFFWFR